MHKVRISELAEVATCQRRVYLRGKIGQRETEEQAAAKERGNVLHDLAYKQSHPEQGSQDRRCFIATSVYGSDAWQTQLLRDFRDSRLRKSRVGTVFISIYYFTSPTIANLCTRYKLVSVFAKTILNKVVNKIGRNQ